MEYLDGNLPPATRRLFEQHLAECVECVAYIASYEATVRLGKAAFTDEGGAPPPEVPEDLVKAVLAARKKV